MRFGLRTRLRFAVLHAGLASVADTEIASGDDAALEWVGRARETPAPNEPISGASSLLVSSEIAGT